MLDRLREATGALLGRTAPPVAPDMGEAFRRLCERVDPYTMTSPERLFGVYQSVEYIVRRKLPGDYVECGVWRGGSSMLAALAFKERDDLRPLWLFDTFEGMPPPTEVDRDVNGGAAADLLRASSRSAGADNTWAWATIDDVKTNLSATGYPSDLLRLVPGLVEMTIPEQAPDQIALLRLDTDWYESTKHELEHLWPRVVPGGVLIVDDYGHWQGARKAVDEFFAAEPVLLNRLDYTGRIAIKA